MDKHKLTNEEIDALDISLIAKELMKLPVDPNYKSVKTIDSYIIEQGAQALKESNAIFERLKKALKIKTIKF